MEVQLLTWVASHPSHALGLFVAYLLFMAAVQALPRPVASSNALYVWAYQCLHLLSVNLSLVFAPRKGDTPFAKVEEEKTPPTPTA